MSRISRVFLNTLLIVLARDTVSPGAATFDLMVDDLQASHARFAELGLTPSVIEGVLQSCRRCFTVREPAGHTITVYSSHVPRPV